MIIKSSFIFSFKEKKNPKNNHLSNLKPIYRTVDGKDKKEKKKKGLF